MIFEICIDSFDAAKMAEEYGANRVELCSALSVGGLSPSISLAKRCSSLPNVEVHSLLRIREGDFVYSSLELEQMISDMTLLADVGVKGVVFGCLKNDGSIDFSANESLINIAKRLKLETTFHRAFDSVADMPKALEEIVELGFDRVLTSGGKPTAIEGIEVIGKLVSQSNRRIEIMAGSGVNFQNAVQLAEAGIDALHFTSHTLKTEESLSGMGSKSVPNSEKFLKIKSLFE